jgi:hypothetical protein
MLLLAVGRRSAVADAQPARAARRKKGAGGPRLATAYSSLPFFYHLRRFCLGATTPTAQHSERSALLLNTFVRIKRGFGYTQVNKLEGDHRLGRDSQCPPPVAAATAVPAAIHEVPQERQQRRNQRGHRYPALCHPLLFRPIKAPAAGSLSDDRGSVVM